MEDFPKKKEVDLSKPAINWYEALGSVMYRSVRSHLVEDRESTIRHYSQVSLRTRGTDLYDEMDVYADVC
jgi:hypothetical protein